MSLLQRRVQTKVFSRSRTHLEFVDVREEEGDEAEGHSPLTHSAG